MLDRQQSVSNLVLDHSECAEVFQRHRIDFCCRGHLSIEAAAEAKNIDVEALVGDLSKAIASRHDLPESDPRELSTPELITHIVAKHHDYLRRALPFARALASKVSRVHGPHNPRLYTLQTAVEDLAATLLPHLDDEEQDLFPELVSNTHGSEVIARHLASMLDDHLEVARVLERIRKATDDFRLPGGACNSYRTLFSELEQIEGDVFKHIHLENHVLSPRFTSA